MHPTASGHDAAKPNECSPLPQAFPQCGLYSVNSSFPVLLCLLCYLIPKLLPSVKIVVLCFGMCLGYHLQTTAQPTGQLLGRSPLTNDSSAFAQRQDTVFALQRLFFEKRRNGRTDAVKGMLTAAVFGTLLALQHPPTTTYQQANRVVTVGFIGLGLGELLRGVVRRIGYRKNREATLCAAVAHGQALPTNIRKRLTAKYFPTPTTTQ